MAVRQRMRAVIVAPKLLERIAADGLGLQRRPARHNRRDIVVQPMSPNDRAQAAEFRRGFRFVAGATSFESIPALTQPQIAFVGRSNVGKSSLINALAQSTVVRVSKTPGLTRQLNFYEMGKMGVAVDMPGYGFAFAKQEDKERWQTLIYDYLEKSPRLRRLFVLLDSRHGIKVIDRQFMQKLEQTKVRYQVVLTKADLVRPMDLARRYTIVRDELKTLPYCVSDVLMISSHTRAGLPKLRRVIRQVLQPTWRAPAEEPEPPARAYPLPTAIIREPRSQTPRVRPPSRALGRPAKKVQRSRPPKPAERSPARPSKPADRPPKPADRSRSRPPKLARMSRSPKADPRGRPTRKDDGARGRARSRRSKQAQTRGGPRKDGPSWKSTLRALDAI